MNISNNIASIQTQQSALNSSAKNVANAQSGKTDLAEEFPKQIIAQEATAMNVSAIKTQDQMLGSLLDIQA
jgi:flagellar hook protein FlgE